ncbi:MAG: hypothetical protein WD749_00665 [Phycisphaerales bacterium]
MTRLSPSYEIARATGVCAATGKKISPGDEFIAALVERDSGEEGGLERVDFSVAAWERGSRPKKPLRLFGHWRTKMHPPGASRKVLIDDASLYDLFEQLEEAEEASRISFRFILALILIRKKVLKYEGARRDSAGGGSGGAVLLVRRATRSGETPAEVIEVCDPQMDDSAVGEAVEQLSAIMAGTAS